MGERGLSEAGQVEVGSEVPKPDFARLKAQLETTPVAEHLVYFNKLFSSDPSFREDFQTRLNFAVNFLDSFQDLDEKALERMLTFAQYNQDAIGAVSTYIVRHKLSDEVKERLETKIVKLRAKAEFELNKQEMQRKVKEYETKRENESLERKLERLLNAKIRLGDSDNLKLLLENAQNEAVILKVHEIAKNWILKPDEGTLRTDGNSSKSNEQINIILELFRKMNREEFLRDLGRAFFRMATYGWIGKPYKPALIKVNGWNIGELVKNCGLTKNDLHDLFLEDFIRHAGRMLENRVDLETIANDATYLKEFDVDPFEIAEILGLRRSKRGREKEAIKLEMALIKALE